MRGRLGSVARLWLKAPARHLNKRFPGHSLLGSDIKYTFLIRVYTAAVTTNVNTRVLYEMILKTTAVELARSSYRALSPFVVFLAFPFSLPVTLGPSSWFCKMSAALIF